MHENWKITFVIIFNRKHKTPLQINESCFIPISSCSLVFGVSIQFRVIWSVIIIYPVSYTHLTLPTIYSV